MATIINNYPVFEKNQVLTESQLNQMVKYLDQQNRLTRVSLLGLGIVCGLDVLCENDTSLTITQGVGITSEGFLIQIGECVNTRYRNYEKPGSVSYPPFEDPLTHQQDITLLELLTDEAIVEPEDVLTDIVKTDIEQMIVLLYLECFDKDLKSCIGKSCDELGIDRIFTLRKLLISKPDLAKVHARTQNGVPDALYPEKFQLPLLVNPRALFSYKGIEAVSYYHMGVNYLVTVKNYYDLLIQNLISTFTTYEPILEEIYGANPFTSANVTNTFEEVKKYFEEFFNFTEPIYGVQYIYDFIKDLTLAYNEFREVAFDLAAICCPDMSRFPKHLMLGQASVELEECEHSKYRNYFVASPILNQQQEKLEHVKYLHKRMVLMVESYSLERFRIPEEVEFKVTPSCEKKGFLSQRTIPFYYDSKLDSSFPNLGTLENTWNYEIYRKCYPSEFPKQISYDNHDVDQVNEHPVTTPLSFDLDQYNFFRIEGIQGKTIKEAMGRLRRVKTEANLPFDIKPVYFGDLAGEEFNDSCAYADLQPSYGIWRNKALLFFNNLVKANKSAEKVVLNRKNIMDAGVEGFSSFGIRNANTRSDSKSKKSTGDNRFKAGETFKNENTFSFKTVSNMMSMENPFDINDAAFQISKLTNDMGNIMSGAEISRSASFESERDTSIRGIFSQLNTCLQDLIKAMPNDFRQFNMKEWLKHYKCAMRMYIQVMKFLASETTSVGAMFIVYFILIILCVMFRVLRFISIYPYITIRILYDTAQERLERLLESYQFAKFLRNHQGMDHKAGAAPGHTFVLVFQQKHDFSDVEGRLEKFGDDFKKLGGELGDRKLFGDDVEFPKSPGFDQISEVTSKMIDNVVADFTVPFICCDDCGDMPHTPITLDPLATPICGIAQVIITNEGKDDDALPLWDYKPVNIRILNDVYDPAVYKVRISEVEGEAPNFGTYTFEKGVYDPDNTKEAQIFKYVVDEDAVAEEMKINKDFFIIDEFKYEIFDVSREEVVDSDLINIFIPVAPSQETTTGNIRGTVTALDGNDPYPVGKALITIIESKQEARTGDLGTYEFLNVPTGTYTLEARADGYVPLIKENVVVESGEDEVANFILTFAANIGYNFNRAFKTMGIQAGSADATKVQLYVNTQMADYKNIADELVKKEGSKEVTAISKAKASVDIYASAKEISVVKLNNDFNDRRNDLIDGWDEASGQEKELYEETLKNLNGAYLDRLAYSQPDKLSKTTSATLKETASIYNSRKELGMKDTIDTWNKNARGYMAEDFRENVSRNLNLK